MARVANVVGKLAVAAGVAVALFGMAAAVTLIALEGGEVVVVRTFDAAGDAHDARVWIADDTDGTWIEVASKDKELYRRIVTEPRIEVVRRNGEASRYVAEPDASPAAHDRIRALLSEKYGWADAWVGMLVDTSQSVAVRLRPDPTAAGRGDPVSAGAGDVQ